MGTSFASGVWPVSTGATGGHRWIFGGEYKYNFLILIIFLILALFIAATIAMTWGLLSLVGLVLILFAGSIVILNRGVGFQPHIFIIAVAVGIFFLLLGTMDMAQIFPQVDLSFLPGAQFLYNLVH